ncbi:unnamed protein product [Amoebophrya sp. A25]|nr:unnamed protein product [Amoebophrya sp. A25]|eukprot:GSA25T00008047001.1
MADPLRGDLYERIANCDPHTLAKIQEILALEKKSASSVKGTNVVRPATSGGASPFRGVGNYPRVVSSSPYQQQKNHARSPDKGSSSSRPVDGHGGSPRTRKMQKAQSGTTPTSARGSKQGIGRGAPSPRKGGCGGSVREDTNSGNRAAAGGNRAAGEQREAAGVAREPLPQVAANSRQSSGESGEMFDIFSVANSSMRPSKEGTGVKAPGGSKNNHGTPTPSADQSDPGEHSSSSSSAAHTVKHKQLSAKRLRGLCTLFVSLTKITADDGTLDERLEKLFYYLDKQGEGRVAKTLLSEVLDALVGSSLSSVTKLERDLRQQAVGFSRDSFDADEFAGMIKAALGFSVSPREQVPVQLNLQEGASDSESEDSEIDFRENEALRLKDTILKAKALAADGSFHDSLDSHISTLYHMQHHYRLVSGAKASVDTRHYGKNSKCYHALLGGGSSCGGGREMSGAGGAAPSTSPSVSPARLRAYTEGNGRLLPLERMSLLLEDHPAVRYNPRRDAAEDRNAVFLFSENQYCRPPDSRNERPRTAGAAARRFSPEKQATEQTTTPRGSPIAREKQESPLTLLVSPRSGSPRRLQLGAARGEGKKQAQPRNHELSAEEHQRHEQHQRHEHNYRHEHQHKNEHHKHEERHVPLEVETQKSRRDSFVAVQMAKVGAVEQPHRRRSVELGGGPEGGQRRRSVDL